MSFLPVGARVRLTAEGLWHFKSGGKSKSPWPWRGTVTGHGRNAGVRVLLDGLSKMSASTFHADFWELDPEGAKVAHGPLAPAPEECVWG